MATIGFFMSGEELGPQEIVAAGRAAEEAGFTHAWVSDHFHPWMASQGESPFVWSVLGALASTTSMNLTTAVTCPTFRIHPAVLAQATATVAAMAPGRFRFGVGSGEALNEHILGDEWPPVSVRHERLEEAITLIRQLWTGSTVTHRGRYYTVQNARIFSLPDEPPPVLVSAFGPEAVDLAARIGDGLITVSPDSEALATFRAHNRGLAQAGTKICWAPTEDEARRRAHELWGHQGFGGQLSQDVPMWHGFQALAEHTTPEQMGNSVPCGPDPERAAQSIRAYLDAGFDEVYVAQMGPDQEGGIRFLAKEVLPLL
jgi:G6PDH family F420-dependent oxidoreductase